MAVHVRHLQSTALRTGLLACGIYSRVRGRVGAVIQGFHGIFGYHSQPAGAQAYIFCCRVTDSWV